MAKIYIWNDETFTKIPNPLKLADGSTISPVREEKFIELGGTVEDDGKPTHLEELESAMNVFVGIVYEIRTFTGNNTFMGGFEEQAKLYNSQAAQDDPTTALSLGIRWSGANDYCDYLANKSDVNMPSPLWFYYMWEREARKIQS